MIFSLLFDAALLAAVLFCVVRQRGAKEEIKQLRKQLGAVPGTIDKVAERVSSLEGGLVPDFEQAKAAVNAVNDFNTGLASIMGYDPLQAVKKARDANGGEGK